MSQSTLSPTVAGPSLTFLRHLLEGYGPRDFAIRFWDGTSIEPDAGQSAQFTLVLHHAGSVRQMFWPFNKSAMGEAYIYNDFDIEGDMQAFMDLTKYLRERRFSALQKLGLLRQLMAMPNTPRPRTGRQGAQLQGGKRSADRDRQAIEYHYDGQPAEFFALFLDRYMQYTCGYFADESESIDQAQERKLDYICRKLRLKPGERLIDFGCGWGGLITFAAKNYGVKAVGVSISQEQIRWTNREIDRFGVRDRCRIENLDYRKVPETELFDKAVSVGFIEHLGEKMMPTFFGKVWRLLRPQGLYLHHGITFRPNTPFPSWRAFALKYVFPDGELVPITKTVHHLAAAGFEIRDVESLREHYIYTLRCWLRRLEENHAEAVRLTDEVNYRIFRIYFAGAIQGFRTALYNLNQTLVVKSGDNVSGLPLTRAAWYA
ncbi:MAG TPA: cyclopropane-fatty-acyl-phospholipid synthase family protein [Gemmataceae bacterium]|nr:cyclopropane-fatty-acyl-phospholipid synthase family protein [Gemmataceae bacterium]